MTCRPNSEPPEDFDGETFETICYKCGRKMTFVRGKMKYHDGWHEEWILDQVYWTDLAFNDLFDSERTVEVTIEPPKMEYP